MSELKAKTSGEIRARDAILGYLWYEKSEADKVIAELEKSHETEVKELLCLIRDKENNFNRAFDSEEKEIRRQKYKRCLDKAEYCKVCSTYYFNISEIEKDEDMVAEYRNISDWYDKWKERWLELAEKFKEAK